MIDPSAIHRRGRRGRAGHGHLSRRHSGGKDKDRRRLHALSGQPHRRQHDRRRHNRAELCCAAERHRLRHRWGPYAFIRPGTQIGDGCRVGDFVEMKKQHHRRRNKGVSPDVGDADLGRDINIGCGVVFVNYDGKEAPQRRGRRGFLSAATPT